MSTELLLPPLILLLVFLAVFSLFLALLGPLRTVRLEMSGETGGEGLLAIPLVWVLVNALARFHRQGSGAEWLATLDHKLLQAGHPGAIRNGAEFMAVADWVGILALLASLLLFAPLDFLSWPMLPVNIAIGVFAGWVTYVWLNDRIAQRRRQITQQYPYFLDLAVMTMEAGASLQETLEIYCRDNRRQVLAEELGGVLKSMQLVVSLREALVDLRARLPSEEVRTHISGLIQGLQMGTAMGQLMREQAEGLRFRRSQMAERAAEELKVKITGPVVLMMGAVLMLIIGPAMIEVFQSGLF